MCLPVQDVLFCISVTAGGAGWFPHTNCTVFPQCVHCTPNQSLAVGCQCPPAGGSSGAGFPISQFPWIIAFKQEPAEAAALQHCSHRPESPPWFWGLPLSYFCSMSHFSFHFQRK